MQEYHDCSVAHEHASDSTGLKTAGNIVQANNRRFQQPTSSSVLTHVERTSQRSLFLKKAHPCLQYPAPYSRLTLVAEEDAPVHEA